MILTASFGAFGTPPTITLPHYRSLVAATARAGFDAALFVRSGPRAPMIDAQVLIAALASVHVEIGLGASFPIDYTEPFNLARSFAAIDRLTRGRSAVVVDLAAGNELAAQFGHRPLAAGRCARALEFFEVVTKLWDSWEDGALLVDRSRGLFADPDKVHRINHDDTHFTVRGPLNAPRPLQGWPVIIVPTTSAASRDFAADVADVVLVRCATQELAQCASSDLREQVAARGRRLQAVRVLADIVPILGRSDVEARRKAEARDEIGGSPLTFVGTAPELAELMRDWHAVGACDGFNFLLTDAGADLDLLGACIAALTRTPAAEGATLRARLELPRPLSRYAA